MPNNTALEQLLIDYQDRTEYALSHWLTRADITPSKLHQAMRYSALDGGKRVRPFLVYATGRALGATLEDLDVAACAVELIHVYSLVHDDLPAMDDDALRRGKATCHIAYDEATAILTGDALQALAFQLLSSGHNGNICAENRLKMVNTLALASGSRGMCGGQAIDLAAVGQELDLPSLENMHIHKTGALIRASVMLGALSANNVEPELIKKLDHYAKCIGLAFQIQDDILDIEGNTATLGKTQGADQALNKPTYPALLGLSGAKERAQDLFQEAANSLESLGDAGQPLHWIAEYIVSRSR